MSIWKVPEDRVCCRENANAHFVEAARDTLPQGIGVGSVCHAAACRAFLVALVVRVGVAAAVVARVEVGVRFGRVFAH